MGFAKKNHDFFLKSLKVVNLLQNAYNIVKFLENVLSALILRFIWHKIKKLGTLEKLKI